MVTCHAGFSGCDYPKAVLWNGTRAMVSRILRESCLPEGKSWQVLTTQGNQLDLFFDTCDQYWTVTEVIRK